MMLSTRAAYFSPAYRRHIASSRMERRPVAPQPEKTIRPPPRTVANPRSTSCAKPSEANTRRAISSTQRSTLCSIRTPSSGEWRKTSSMPRVKGFDCSVGRNPK